MDKRISRYARLIGTLLLGFVLSFGVLAEERSVISRDQLQEMFHNMANTPGWDVSKPMLWGYFFTHASRSPLEKAAKQLMSKGYRVVGIYVGDKDSPSDPDVWWLHVEKIENHSVDSLDRRNKEFNRLAESLELDSYDGMDVGPVSGDQ